MVTEDSNFDIFGDVTEFVNPGDAIECKQNILFAIEETMGLSAKDVYEAIKNVVESYYGNIAFDR